MAKKIAINGFGRIGRLAFRQLFEIKEVEVVAINDLTAPKTLAYLLEHDSAHGSFYKGKISYNETSIVVDGHEIKVCAEKDAANLPWGSLGIDLVVESTGFYTEKDKAMAHIKAGAKKVVISAPAKGDLKTVVYGVNLDVLSKEDQIISCASCTTNCLAPLAHVLDNNFKIKAGLMTTVHAVTNDQRLLDLPHSDLRRGRAAIANIIPTSTGAASAIGLVLPNLKGKLDGLALRVPVITGSIVDLTVELEKDVTVEEINKAMQDAIHADKKLAEAYAYNKDPIVSSDVIGETHGSIFDATLTKKIVSEGKVLYKVFAWYDNENSYTSQLVRTIKHFISL